MCVQKVQHVSYFSEFLYHRTRGRKNKESKVDVFKRKPNLMLFVTLGKQERSVCSLHSLKRRRAGFDPESFSYLPLAKTIDRKRKGE